MAERLNRAETGIHESIPNPADPYRDYLNALYEQIVALLEQAVFSEIVLESESTPDAVGGQALAALPIGFWDAAGVTPGSKEPEVSAFTSFGQAFAKYKGRVLLLGGPGSGKTTTLLAFARDAVAARLHDTDLPVPVLGRVSGWDSEAKASIAAWLAHRLPMFDERELEELIGSGGVLLLLDGLDELGPEREDKRTGRRYDPRARFIEILPSTGQLVLTSRARDYEAIGTKVPANGAVTLRPLDDEQLRRYLEGMPTLQSAIDSDDTLRELVRAPLLLNIFTRAFANHETELESVRSLDEGSGDLRDAIFTTFVRRRYDHERRQVGELDFSFERLRDVLGVAATRNAGMYGAKENVLKRGDFRLADNESESRLLDVSRRLHVLIANGDDTYSFAHLLLRDYFAFECATRHIRGDRQGNFFFNEIAAGALKALADPRSLELLLSELSRGNDERPKSAPAGFAGVGVADYENNVAYYYMDIAGALGRIGSPRAVEPLSAALRDWHPRVRREARRALEEIGTPEALFALESGKKQR